MNEIRLVTRESEIVIVCVTHVVLKPMAKEASSSSVRVTLSANYLVPRLHGRLRRGRLRHAKVRPKRRVRPRPVRRHRV